MARSGEISVQDQFIKDGYLLVENSEGRNPS